jgi:hypothetical protein
LDATELTPRDIAAWHELEDRALEANAYHSPFFVLPALRHLDAALQAQVILIERVSPASTELLGVAVVRQRVRSPLTHLPHVEVYVSRHSYLGVPLLDRHDAAAAAHTLLRHLRRQMPASAGLVIRHIDARGALLATLQELMDDAGTTIGHVGATQRAMLVPAWAGVDCIKGTLRSKYADIERCRRRLSEIGKLHWTAHREHIEQSQVDDFLRLEHGGWKAEAGTSLRSSRHDEDFFRAMTGGFAAAGRALFTELTLDGRAIASTSNYVSGGVGFAFKIGWDERYRKFGPGILNETELVCHAPTICADLRYIDSGAVQNAYIDKLWPQRRQLVSVFLPTTGWGAVAWTLIQHARGLRAADKATQLEQTLRQGRAKTPA